MADQVHIIGIFRSRVAFQFEKPIDTIIINFGKPVNSRTLPNPMEVDDIDFGVYNIDLTQITDYVYKPMQTITFDQHAKLLFTGPFGGKDDKSWIELVDIASADRTVYKLVASLDD